MSIPKRSLARTIDQGMRTELCMHRESFPKRWVTLKLRLDREGPTFKSLAFLRQLVLRNQGMDEAHSMVPKLCMLAAGFGADMLSSGIWCTSEGSISRLPLGKGRTVT